MPHDELDRMTLADKLTEALRLNRELTEHLEQAVAFKAYDLRRAVRPPKPGGGDDLSDRPAVTDAGVREYAATLLSADQFTWTRYGRLTDFCDAIEEELRELVGA